MKRLELGEFRDADSAYVAAYESYLDLFTLLSFILIVAAVMYMAAFGNGDQGSPPIVAQANTEAQVFSSVVAQVAGHGSGVPHKLPQNSLLLVIYREDSIDKLAVMGGTGVGTNQMVITMDNVETVLNNLQPALNRASSIDIDVHKGKQDVNPAVFLAMLRWLTTHNLIKYNLYYTGG